MRLIFVTQSVDAEDPILGATVAKLRALAQRCDELVVITDRIGVHDLPANVHAADVRRPDAARPRPPVHARARAAAAVATAARRADRPHVPDLSRARGSPREDRPAAARDLVHALGDRPGTAARDGARRRRAERRPAFVPDRPAEGAGNRARHRRRAVRSAARRPPGTGRCVCSRSGAPRRRRASRHWCGRVAAPGARDSSSGSTSTARRRPTRSGGIVASSRR